MASMSNFGNNCGMVCIYNLIDTKDFLATYKPYKNMRLVAFTDTVEFGRGERIYTDLEKLNIGVVHKSAAVYNPNSRNNVVLYYWLPSTEYRKSLGATS